MYKIAILGCENSHAKNFLDLISKGLYPEIEVVGVYSNEYDAVEKLHDTFGTRIMESFDECVGRVDGVMITARHGDNHYKYAKPYLDSGIPMFIDKPITCTEEDALAFMREAQDKGVRLCGGSTCAALCETLSLADDVNGGVHGELLGGSVCSPLISDSPYGGFYFYAQHLVEIMTTIFGGGIREVLAERCDKTLEFSAYYDGYRVNGTYVEKGKYYTAGVYGYKSARSEILNFTPDSFRHEMDDMLHLLRGGEMKKSYEEFILPVFVMNAIVRSLESGKKERLNEIIL